MIISFYAATLQLIFNEEQGKHLFPATEPIDRHYIRITGSWNEGLRIYHSNEIEYNARRMPGVFYKLTSTSLSKGQIGIANVGWGILGALKRSDYVIPSRGEFQVELAYAGEHAVIKVPPLSEVHMREQTRKPAAPRVKNIAAPAPPAAPVIAPEAPLPTPAPIIQRPAFVAPAPITAAPVVTGPVIRKIVETGDKSVDELRGLSAELNKTLSDNAALYVTVRDGLLYLEEETVEYEEF